LQEELQGNVINLWKNRKGDFWEDGYHATDVETGVH